MDRMNEYEIIDLLTKIAGRLPPRYSSIGDDVVSLLTRPGKLVLKSDMLVGRTDVPPGMTFRQVGRKAVAMCVSDFASKGVRPEALMVSLGIPRTMKRSEIHELAMGLKDALDAWKLHLVGGDTNEADDLVVDSILVGFSSRIVARNGAKPGDAVIVTGPFGTTSAGLKILLNGATAEPKFRRKALKSVYYPTPRLDLGLSLGNCLSSAMDSSDGLAICLHSIASASGTGIEVDELPHERELGGFSRDNGFLVRDLVLYGGEEYEIVGTVPLAKLRAAREAGSRVKVIGRVTEDRKVTMLDGTPIDNRGWVHLA